MPLYCLAPPVEVFESLESRVRAYSRGYTTAKEVAPAALPAAMLPAAQRT